MYPGFSGSFDKRLLIRDAFIIYFKERRRRPVVTVSNKHVYKTKEMILVVHLMYTSIKIR